MRFVTSPLAERTTTGISCVSQVGFQCAEDLLAVQSGEEEVEDHEIGPDPTDDVETDEAIRGRADLEPLTGEAMRQEIGDIGLVFDYRDVAHGPPPDEGIPRMP